MKDKSVIPIGLYCYTIIDIEMTPKGPVIKVKQCPYWSDGYCEYLESNEGLLFDQSKECGENLGDEE